MQYYAAPMEGLTDRVWRQAQQKWFGPEGPAGCRGVAQLVARLLWEQEAASSSLATPI